MNNKKVISSYINIKLSETEKNQLKEVASQYNFKNISKLIKHVSIDQGDILANKKHYAFSNISRAKNMLKNLREVKYKDRQNIAKNITIIEKGFSIIQKKIKGKYEEAFTAGSYKLKAKPTTEARINFRVMLNDEQKKKANKIALKNQFYSKSNLLKYPLYYYNNKQVENQAYALDAIKIYLADFVLKIYKNNIESINDQLVELHKRLKKIITVLQNVGI